jgi:hypothetical protein
VSMDDDDACVEAFYREFASIEANVSVCGCESVSVCM